MALRSVKQKRAESAQADDDAGDDEEWAARFDSKGQEAAYQHGDDADGGQQAGDVAGLLQADAAELVQERGQPAGHGGILDEDQGVADDQQKDGAVAEYGPDIAQCEERAGFLGGRTGFAQQGPGDGAEQADGTEYAQDGFPAHARLTGERPAR